eukprot:Hpha_TRINITY_DN16387_c2_g1::TRINITY_DN16387_c2_g1_i3::g.62124::m.62124
MGGEAAPAGSPRLQDLQLDQPPSAVMLRAGSVLAVCASAAAAPGFVPSQEPNMNGDYPFSTTPGGKPGLFPKAYKDYPGGVEYYDVYSPPITTLYSQVWWSPLAPTKLPEEMVQKYAGKGMAIVGWEIDQVQKTPEGDVSVPINANYNHHYTSVVIGAGARFKKVMLDGPDDPRADDLRKMSGHGMIAVDQPQYLVEEVQESALGLPQTQAFSSANGGEYRKTFHGFSPGHALVVDSPTSFQITPMQIDTWNREKMNISKNGLSTFAPGPLPRSSLAPPNAPYSGLLECPMTTRIAKAVDGQYTVRSVGACDNKILTFQECFAAAAATLGQGDSNHRFVNQTVSDPNRPSGCSASMDPSDPFTVHVYFNKLADSTVACAQNAPSVAGTTASLVRVNVNLTSSAAVITLAGPATVWFGVGFGAHNMADAPWTVVVDGNGTVSEHKLANHAAGTQLAPSVKVLSHSVAAGVRTVVLTRPLKGSSADYYTFNPASADTTIPFINAVGSGPAFAYHKDRAPSALTLLPNGGGGACVCPEAPKPFGQATGKLVYHRVESQKADTGTGSVGFGANKCAPWPSTVMINQSNPTCDIRHYRGGQWACHHMWSLLDADQEIPWADQPLVFHHKYRFWVQPYNASYHQKLTLGERAGSAMLIGSPWEYDVPKCAEGVAGCSVENGTWVHTITGGLIGKHTLAALNFHCHAPTCLTMEVWACPKGTPIPECNPSKGKLICREQPVHGGSGDPSTHGTRFDETGYIAIPQCMWGPKEFGLEAPVDITGLTLHVIKRCNATDGHYGEMAGGQPWVF